MNVGHGVHENDNEEQLMLDDEEERKEQMDDQLQMGRDSDHAEMGQDGGNQRHVTSGQGQNEMCKLCYEAECDAAFIPCGHVTACIKCAGKCH